MMTLERERQTERDQEVYASTVDILFFRNLIESFFIAFYFKSIFGDYIILRHIQVLEHLTLSMTSMPDNLLTCLLNCRRLLDFYVKALL